MIGNQNAAERGLSRPIVLGFVLLLLFYSTTQDWSSVGGNSTHEVRAKGTGAVTEVAAKTREQMIRDLVRTNEALEKENGDLRLEILTLKSELKEHDSTREDSLSVKSIESNSRQSEISHLEQEHSGSEDKTFAFSRKIFRFTSR